MAVFLMSQVLGRAAAMNSHSITVSQPEPSFEHKRGHKYFKVWETKPWVCQDRHKRGHKQVLALRACLHAKSSFNALEAAVPAQS